MRKVEIGRRELGLVTNHTCTLSLACVVILQAHLTFTTIFHLLNLINYQRNLKRSSSSRNNEASTLKRSGNVPKQVPPPPSPLLPMSSRRESNPLSPALDSHFISSLSLRAPSFQMDLLFSLGHLYDPCGIRFFSRYSSCLSFVSSLPTQFLLNFAGCSPHGKRPLRKIMIN